MAMNHANLTSEMASKITSTADTVIIDTNTLQAIAEAVVEHIQNNAVVSTSVPGTGLTGYSGTPISGTAAGTGTIS